MSTRRGRDRGPGPPAEGIEWQSISRQRPKRACARRSSASQRLRDRGGSSARCARAASAKLSLPRVDLLAVGDDARDGAEPGADARRAGVDVAGQRVVEHGRVELVGLAVGVDEGAREEARQQRGAVRGRRREQLVDEGVLGPAQRERVEPRGRREARAGSRCRYAARRRPPLPSIAAGRSRQKGDRRWRGRRARRTCSSC